MKEETMEMPREGETKLKLNKDDPHQMLYAQCLLLNDINRKLGILLDYAKPEVEVKKIDFLKKKDNG